MGKSVLLAIIVTVAVAEVDAARDASAIQGRVEALRAQLVAAE